jgi:hypothetical protein
MHTEINIMTQAQATRVISRKDTTQMMRKTLKAAFPDVKFSVRLTNGGSVYVTWTDGPAFDTVNDLLKHFEGHSFDPMDDLRSLRETTNASGERIRYQISFVMCNREYSPEFAQQAADWFNTSFGWNDGIAPEFEVAVHPSGTAWLKAKNDSARFGNEWASTFVGRIMRKLTPGGDFNSVMN